MRRREKGGFEIVNSKREAVDSRWSCVGDAIRSSPRVPRHDCFPIRVRSLVVPNRAEYSQNTFCILSPILPVECLHYFDRVSRCFTLFPTTASSNQSPSCTSIGDKPVHALKRKTHSITPLIPSLNSMSRYSLISRKGCQSKQLSNCHRLHRQNGWRQQVLDCFPFWIWSLFSLRN